MTELLTRPAPARFAVDAWDPSYGVSQDFDGELEESSAQLDLDVEVPQARWRPISPRADTAPPAVVLFVDGVRRIDARLWVHEPDGSATPGICASYAAGVVACTARSARVLAAQVRRGVFTASAGGTGLTTCAGVYPLRPTTPGGGLAELSLALQRSLAQAEAEAARAARTHRDGCDDLLVMDGPLRGRTHLERALGLVKTHRTSYLPPELHALVGRLAAAQRTPVFAMGTSWRRFSWYLRLPGRAEAPWAGIVRLECRADLPAAQAVELATLSQATLPRFASAEYKDHRAPQNLFPIAGLEWQLRRRLGHPAVLYRALRAAAHAR